MIKPAETLRFLFERRPDIEASHNWLLAGRLTLNVPKAPVTSDKPPAEQHQDTINVIVAELAAWAIKGELPPDGLILDWRDGAPPEGFVPDGETIEAWRARSFTVRVRARLSADRHILAEIRVLDEDDDEERPTVH
jgi:hypothetical protein